MYHAAHESAFSALGALGLTLAGWATLLVTGVAITMAAVDVTLAIVVGQLALATVALVAVRVTRRDRRALGIVRPRARLVAAAVLVGGSLWFLNLLLVSLLGLDTRQSTEVLVVLVDQPPLWLVLLSIVAVPAVCEELVFRGLLLRGLASQLHPWVAVLASAIVFSVYHLNPPQMVTTFTFGLALGFLALRARSAIPTMLAHAVNNGIAVLIVRGELPAPDRYPLGPAAAAAGLLTVGGLALAATGTRGES